MIATETRTTNLLDEPTARVVAFLSEGTTAENRVNMTAANMPLHSLENLNDKTLWAGACMGRIFKAMAAIVRCLPGNSTCNAYWLLNKAEKWMEPRRKALGVCIKERMIESKNSNGKIAAPASLLASFTLVEKRRVVKDDVAGFARDFNLTPKDLETYRKPAPPKSMEDVDLERLVRDRGLVMAAPDILDGYFRREASQDLYLR